MWEYKDLAREHQKVVKNPVATKAWWISKETKNTISLILENWEKSIDQNRKIFEKLCEKIKQNYDFSDGELKEVLKTWYERFVKNQVTVWSWNTEKLEEIFFIAVVRMSNIAKRYWFTKNGFRSLIKNLSYYDATKIESLFIEYEWDEFLEKWMIKSFVVNNPKDPKQAIEKAKQQYEKLLQKKYLDPRITKKFIQFAVTHYPNSQDPIWDYLKVYPWN